MGGDPILIPGQWMSWESHLASQGLLFTVVKVRGSWTSSSPTLLPKTVTSTTQGLVVGGNTMRSPESDSAPSTPQAIAWFGAAVYGCE